MINITSFSASFPKLGWKINSSAIERSERCELHLHSALNHLATLDRRVNAKAASSLVISAYPMRWYLENSLMFSTTFQLHGRRLQRRALPPERRRALQRQHGRERQVLAASEATAVSLAGRVE